MSSIYLICNTTSGDFYIGSTIRPLSHRWSNHLSQLLRGKHHSIFMQNSWNKYGSSAFLWVELEQCSKEDTLTREQFYIDTYCPTFNSAKIAGNTVGIVFTEERKQKMSKALKGKLPWNKGLRTVTIEQKRERNKIQQRKQRAHLVRKTKEEIVEVHRQASPRKRAVIRNDGLVASSAREMARIMGIGHSEIVRGIKRSLNVRGFTFSYA